MKKIYDPVISLFLDMTHLPMPYSEFWIKSENIHGDIQKENSVHSLYFKGFAFINISFSYYILSPPVEELWDLA